MLVLGLLLGRVPHRRNTTPLKADRTSPWGFLLARASNGAMASRRRWVIALVLFLGALPLLIWWALQASQQAAFEEFRTAVAELEAAGERTWLPEFYAEEIPDEANGAIALMDALHMLQVATGGETAWPIGPWHMEWPERGDLDDEQRATLRSWFEQHLDFYDSVDTAIGAPRFRFPLTADASGWPGGADPTALIQVLHLLQARAVSASTQTDRLNAAAALLRLAERWETVSLLDHAIAATMRKTACGEIRREMASGLEDPERARDLLEPLLNVDTLNGAPDCIRGERAFALSACRAVIGAVDSDDSMDPVDPSGPHGTLFHAARAEFGGQGGASLHVGRLARDAAERARRLQALIETPISDHRSYQSAVVTARDEMRGEDNWIETQLFPGMANAMFSIYPSMMQSFAEVDTEQRLARLALAAACARAADGVWPAAATDLASFFPDGVPDDPFTGEAMRCAQAEGQLVLSSPGPTVGAPWDGPTDEQPHNLLWRVAEPVDLPGARTRSLPASNDDR